MLKSGLDLKGFTDYRTFLIAHAQEMKSARRGWSYGAWARALGLKTTSSVTKIIQGQRHPGAAVTEKLISYFAFDESEAEYFRDLVRLPKVKRDPRLSVLLMEKMSRAAPNGVFKLLDSKTFSVISNWFYLPVRELAAMENFIEDPVALAQTFLFKITPREIRQALDTLEELGLLRRDSRNRLRPADQRLRTESDVASEGAKRYHEQMLALTTEAIRLLDVSNRELTGSSFVMRADDLPRAKEMIREFRQTFIRAFESNSGDAVFQFQMQLFPLTKEEGQTQ